MLDFLKSILTEKLDVLDDEEVFSYDFPSSGFDRVDRVRFSIEDQSEWDYSPDKESLVRNIGTAAARFGFGPNFSDEESALCLILAKTNAGPLIMTYAWGLYADMLVQDMAA